MNLLVPSETFAMFTLFFKMYWKAIFCVAWPLILLPIYLFDIRPATACCYVVLLMCGYWIFDVLPLAVTGFIPMALFPTLGILSSEKTSLNYFHDAIMLFTSGFIIGLAIQSSRLHIRISFICITKMGGTPRKFLVGFVTVTMFVSFWISNTATTFMMMPIVDMCLTDMQEFGYCKVWEDDDTFTGSTEVSASASTLRRNTGKKPTKISICYHLAIAYVASIGGLGTVIGTVANLIMKGIYEQTFPSLPPISFAKWMLLCIPTAILMTVLVTLFLEIYYLGLFRPDSAEAKAVYMNAETEKICKDVVKQRLLDLGPWTFHELMVGILFILVVFMWLFRQMDHPLRGWSSYLDVEVKDTAPAMLIVVLMFLIPSHPGFLLACTNNAARRPLEPSTGLLTWKLVQAEVPWGLIFVIGGGFALGDGSRTTGMCAELAKHVNAALIALPDYAAVILFTVITTILTQLANNCAIANLLLPTLAEIARQGHRHPLLWMLPVALSTSFGFCLPLSTPPNAIAAAHCNITRKEMFKIGLVVCVICLLVLNTVFPLLGKVIFGFSLDKI